MSPPSPARAGEGICVRLPPLDKNHLSGANARLEQEPHVNDRPNSLAARDIAYYFHPATNARRHEQVGPMMIERGEGVYVFDDQGKPYIEGLRPVERRGRLRR